MKRLLFIGLILLAYGALSLSADAARGNNLQPFGEAGVYKSCGVDCQTYDGNNDGCMGADEFFVFSLHGDLAAGESFTWTYPTGEQEGGVSTPGLICQGGRTLRAELHYKGQAELEVELVFVRTFNGEVTSDAGPLDACIVTWTGVWHVTVVNLGERAKRDIDLVIRSEFGNRGC